MTPQSDWYRPSPRRREVNFEKTSTRGKIAPQMTQMEIVLFLATILVLVLLFRVIGLIGFVVILAAIWFVFFMPRIQSRRR